MGDDATPTHVIDHVFLGSKVHAKDRDQLKQLKITHILNVTPTKKLDSVAGVPNFFEKDKLFEYRRCAIFDNKAEDISGALEGCVAFIDRAKFYGRVLVHCSKGVSRSVSMVVAYLIKVHGMTYTDALQLVQTKRSIAQPNPSFEKQLIAYSERMERLRKRKEGDGKSANARVSSAPVGPSRGPLRPPTAEAIGPQLPPHLMKLKASEEPNSAAKSTEGPSSDTPRTEKAHEEGEEEGERARAAPIGPTIPSKRKVEASGDSDVVKDKKQRFVGPARPPTA